jgi:alkylation response protein AidB-like acyl-CoA dehydrogenase
MDESIDLDALSDSARDVLGNESPIEVVQRHVDGDTAAATRLWATAVELGWLAICAPEASGGLGLSAAAACAVLREVGRALAPAPLLSGLLAVEALTTAAPTAAAAAWLEQLIAGAARAAVGDIADEPQARLLARGSDFTLEGEARLWEAGDADLLLIPALDPAGAWRLVVVERATPGLTVEPRPTVDGTRASALARLQGLDVLAAQVLTFESPAPQRGLLRFAALGAAADALGGAEAILERTIDYLKIREQFGRPIGSFQALKHRVADHKAGVLGAQALLGEAAADTDLQSALEVKALATQVYLTVARDCIQLHGGIGFTWEHPAHLFLKRALVNSMMFGTIEASLDRFVSELVA